MIFRNCLASLILFFIIGCNSNETTEDPCVQNFNEVFPNKILAEFPNIEDAKIYSFPGYIKSQRQKKSTIITSSQNLTGDCLEAILDLKYESEATIESEKSITDAVKLFFRDPLNKVEKLNLRVINSFPPKDYYYSKNKIDEFSFQDSTRLNFELKQSNFTGDSLEYNETIRNTGRIFLEGDLKVKNYLRAELSFSTNIPDLDEKMLSIKNDYSREIKKRNIDVLILRIKISQPNYYSVNGEDYDYIFSSYEYVFKNL